MILEINRQGQPFVLFIHPWQLTGLPEVKIGRLLKGPSKFFYLHKISEEKLRHLLKNHSFVTIWELLADWSDKN